MRLLLLLTAFAALLAFSIGNPAPKSRTGAVAVEESGRSVDAEPNGRYKREAKNKNKASACKRSGGKLDKKTGKCVRSKSG